MAHRPWTEGVAQDFVLGAFAGGTLGFGVEAGTAGTVAASAAALTSESGSAEAAAAGQGLGIVSSAVGKLGVLAEKFGTPAGSIVTQAITAGQRMVDVENEMNVNLIIPRPDAASGFIRVTLNPEQTKIISAGLMRANQILNGIESGRFVPFR